MMTNYLRKKLGDHTLGKASFTMPTTVYMGLFASNPGDDGSQASELTFVLYARVAVTSKFDAFTLATGRTTNNAEINFGQPGTSDNPAAYVGLLDASTGGNMLMYERLTKPRAIQANGRQLRFLTGKVAVRMI